MVMVMVMVVAMVGPTVGPAQDHSLATNPDFEAKNDRPGDDGTLRSVQLLVFLLGVIDLASASAKILLV